MIVGFTGTQRGMTEKQKAALADALAQTSVVTLIHGDCIGADREAHEIMRSLCPDVWIHACPSTMILKRAYCRVDSSAWPAPPLERNRAIVREVQLLIAAPAQAKEVLRSGTWATIRYARKLGVPVLILEP